MKALRWLWWIQLVWAFSGMLPFIFTPRDILASTTGLEPDAIHRLVVDQVQMIGAGGVALSAATALAVTRQSFAYLKGLSFIFLVFMTSWSTVLLFNSVSGFYQSWVPFTSNVPGYIFAALNLLVLLQHGGRVAPRPAESAPKHVRTLWAVQGLYYLTQSAVCLLAAGWVLRWVSGEPALEPPFERLAQQQVRILSAWTISLALLSLYASLEYNIRDWRMYRWAFALAIGFRSAAVLINHLWGTYTLAAAVSLMAPDLVFLALGLRWTSRNAPGDAQIRVNLTPAGFAGGRSGAREARE